MALIVDAVDGPLARRVDTATRLPWFDGAILDFIVDYSTYVLVPAMVVAQSDLVPLGFRAELRATAEFFVYGPAVVV